MSGEKDATREALRKVMDIWPVTIEDRDHWKARAEKAEAALVVEQHTHGPITELRDVKAERDVLKAAIARVRDVLTVGPLHRLDFPKYKDPYAIDRHVIAAAIDGVQPDRAALEGEQQ